EDRVHGFTVTAADRKCPYYLSRFFDYREEEPAQMVDCYRWTMKDTSNHKRFRRSTWLPRDRGLNTIGVLCISRGIAFDIVLGVQVERILGHLFCRPFVVPELGPGETHLPVRL